MPTNAEDFWQALRERVGGQDEARTSQSTTADAGQLVIVDSDGDVWRPLGNDTWRMSILKTRTVSKIEDDFGPIRYCRLVPVDDPDSSRR